MGWGIFEQQEEQLTNLGFGVQDSGLFTLWIWATYLKPLVLIFSTLNNLLGQFIK